MSFLKYYLVFGMVVSCHISSVFAQSLESFEREFVKIIEKIHASVVSLEINARLEKGNTSGRSGIVIDDKGHIVTVASGLQNSNKILVQLQSGKKYPAKFLALDSTTNVAVLKIDAPGLCPIEKRALEPLKLGSILIIIGNPYGFNKSVATGIVSGLDRTVFVEGNCQTGLIQTTTPINPGDAGALVVDSRGRFVGMASSTLGRNIHHWREEFYLLKKLLDMLERESQLTPGMRKMGKEIEKILPPFSNGKNFEEYKAGIGNNAVVAEGINFIIPANSILWAAQEIIEHGKVRRGWVGIKVKNAESEAGVIVTQVFPNSPAQKSGIRIGDRLVLIDDKQIESSYALLHIISHSLATQKITFGVFRDGVLQTMVLQLQELPESSPK